MPDGWIWKSKFLPYPLIRGSGRFEASPDVISGIEPGLNIVMHISVPKSLLVDVLRDFGISFPAMEFSVVPWPMELSDAALRAGEADIGNITEAPYRGLMEG